MAEGVSVPDIAPALRDNINGAAISKSEFGGKGVAVDLVFLDGVHRKVDDAVLAGAIFILATVNHGEIVAAVAAAN